MAGEGRIRVGIVGLGKIAVDQHIPVIRAHPDFELVAVASSRPAALPGLPRSFATLTEMLAGAADCEAVAICTPAGPRYGLAREALLAGRHVLLEKPPAATLAEAEDLTRIAREADRTLFATWHSRFAPAVEATRRALAGETVRRLRVTWKEDVRHWHPGQDWIWQPGGFGVFDPGINAFSILTRILPEPIFVRTATLEVPSNRDAPIAATVAFSGPGGADRDLTAELDWRQAGPQSWDIEIGTETGRTILLSEGGSRLTLDGELAAAAQPSEYRGLYDRWAGLIRAGRSDVDLSPLRLVADAFLLGRTIKVAPFAD